MIGDLHIHSWYSDGSYSIRDAIVRAKERGLRFVSIVDHDTTEGSAEAIETGLRLGVDVITGVEISAYDFTRDRKVHLLGYGYRLPATAIEALCAPLRDARHRNTLRQIQEIAAAGYTLDEAAVRAHARPGGCLYKQHVMLALIEAGATDEIYSDLYRRLFKGDGVAAHDIAYVDVFDALRAIHEDGGKAVLAHPGQLDSFELAEELADAGLDGIELYHEDHDACNRQRVLDIAKRRGLFVTGGSDDHGTYGSKLTMGDICAPDGAFEAITRPADADAAWTVDLVRRAGAIARRALAEVPDVELKGDNIQDLVTVHDRAIDRFLIDSIAERFPNDAFVTEEHEHETMNPDADVWIIDPIDGTTNFVASRNDFAICVARYRGPQPIFGIVYDVIADDLFLGIAGDGAWCNGVALGKARSHRPIAMRDCVLECSLNAVHHLSMHPDADITPIATQVRAQRSLGSAAIAICHVAAGNVDAYLSWSLALWDYAAAVVVLTEAGGTWEVRTRSLAPPDFAWEIGPADPGERRVFLGAAHGETVGEIAQAIFAHP